MMIFGIKELEITYHKKDIKFCSPLIDHVWESPFYLNDVAPSDKWLEDWENPDNTLEGFDKSKPRQEAGFFAHRDLFDVFESSSHALVRGFGKTSIYDGVFRSQGMQLEAMILSRDCIFASHPREFDCGTHCSVDLSRPTEPPVNCGGDLSVNTVSRESMKAIGYTTLRPIVRPGGIMKMAIAPADIKEALKTEGSDYHNAGMFLEPLCQHHYDLFLSEAYKEFKYSNWNAGMENFFFPTEIVRSALRSKYGINTLDSFADVPSYLKENYNYMIGEY